MPTDDIFDKAAASSGDIFDQAAAASAPAVPSFQDAANQSKQQFLANSPLAPTERAMQQTMGGPPTFVDVPKGKKEAFEKAGKEGYATGAKVGMALPLIPSAIAAPIPTALGVGGSIVGGYAGQYLGKKGAETLGAAPDTAEMAGDVGGVVGGVAGGAGMAASPFAKWLGASKTLGARLLQQASAKAGNAPIELSPHTNELVEEIVKQGKLGGKVPKVISDLLERLGPSTRQAADAEPGPLTYDEARIVQGNASDLSAEERMTLKGSLRSLVPRFAKSFSRDVQTGADQAGIGTEHAAGMKEYATASERDRALAKLNDAKGSLLKGALGAAGAGAAYGVYRNLTGQR